MKFQQTEIEDLYVLTPRIFEDDRGYFMETYNEDLFLREAGLVYNFVQDNESSSDYGVIRGLHFQKGDDAQAKLVRVITGSVLDVAVDIRPDSPTFGKHYSIVLSGDNKKQLLVPRGFAHGFAVLEDNTIFAYKCDNFYNAAKESGIHYQDPALNIDWQIPTKDHIISAKDMVLPYLKK